MVGWKNCRTLSGSDRNPKKLILAAADFAEGYTDDDDNPLPAPPELMMAFQVEQWGQAVYSRPLPAQMLRRMTVTLNVYNAVKSYQAGSLHLADWARSNPTAAKMIAEIRELRQANDR